MITLHHLDNSRSQRILWMLEELGLEYEVKYHKRDPKTMMAPASLRAVHPLGKAPVLVDSSGDVTETLVESGAILEYLVAKYGEGRFKPKPGTSEFLRYTFWMHFSEGSAMLPLVLKLIFNQIASPPIPLVAKLMILPVVKGIAAQMHKLVIDPGLLTQQKYMEDELKRSEWFAGSEFTAADVIMSFVVEASAAGGGLPISKYPKLNNFLERIHSRPAYKKALEIGGPFKMPG